MSTIFGFCDMRRTAVKRSGDFGEFFGVEFLDDFLRQVFEIGFGDFDCGNIERKSKGVGGGNTDS